MEMAVPPCQLIALQAFNELKEALSWYGNLQLLEHTSWIAARVDQWRLIFELIWNNDLLCFLSCNWALILYKTGFHNLVGVAF